MENLLQKSSSIFHNIFKNMNFQEFKRGFYGVNGLIITVLCINLDSLSRTSLASILKN